MYEYDNTILNDIVLPSGIEKNTLIDTILINWGGYNCRWSDPNLFKRATQTWFKANYNNFEHIISALNAEYNPIENYDRTETHEANKIVTTAETSNEAIESQSTESGTGVIEHNENKTDTNSDVPFDTENFKNVSRLETDCDLSENSKETSEGIASSNTNSSTNTKEDGSESYTSHIHGNIGVTTNQQMIQSEIELRQYNIYKEIAWKYAIDFVYLNS